jgi:hypothetical protein
VCDGGFDALEKIPALRFGDDSVDPRVAGSVLKTFQIYHGKKNDWDSGVQAGHHAGYFNAIDVGHGKVEQNQVRL